MSTVVKDLGAVSAYAYAVEKGYTGTEEEFAELMADYADVGQRAEDAAGSALNSKTAAQTAATTATNKASEASTAAQTATTKAGEVSQSASQAQASAQTASTKASEASASASTATAKATEATTAATSANTAKTDAVAAKTAAETAQGKAETAQGAAEDAAESVSASVAQIATNTSDISDLKEDLTHAFPHDTVSGAVASFADGADDVPMDSVIVNIEPVQSGSGDPSPTNVRPISGWSEVNVQRTGKNLFDEANATIYKRYFQAVIGGYVWSPISDSSSYVFKCFPNTTYTLKPNNPNITLFRVATINVGIEESENATLNQVTTEGISRTITTDADAKYIVIQMNNAIVSTKATQLQIELGESATEFEPYQSTSITIALGQTVYGGTLDVVSGVLTVDRAMADMGIKDWVYRTDDTIVNVPYFNGNFLDRKPGSINFICSCYANTRGTRPSLVDKSCATYNSSNSTSICIADSAYTDATTFKTAMTGQTIVYELATPITIQLTPQQINSLLGVNNIWADSGDTTAEYRADTKLFIERLTAPDSADMIADSNITSGSYFMVGNNLYKATANIASGSAVIVGTNCTRKSLSEALNEINA